MMNPVTPQQSDPIIGQMVGTYRVEAGSDAAEWGCLSCQRDHAWRVCGTESAVALLGRRSKRCDEFLEEAKTLARVRPNDFVKVNPSKRCVMVPCLSYGIYRWALAGKYASGQSGTPLSVSQALGIARRVASAMAAAHAAGIIHRESTPPLNSVEKTKRNRTGKRRENRSYIHLPRNGCPGFCPG